METTTITETKPAGQMTAGDRILWDGVPVTVTAAEPFSTVAGDYIEFIVQGETFVQASVLEADVRVWVLS